ncbi:DUF5686 and carboxypeptidase regulatory-like domain-containing protein [Flavobacterium gawalongense]|uniref:Carboxypeptidase-like regulatory domain-containing protein n=1 Tax=Flavobacterium gawalongense TaxID=2594432 RepID=A0A553BL15_9FLAO|nr:DUF5686 and carboxypeptidase regulatory-like domain-containing protein [Flavobacterium gawalongense]TRX00428.1 carboxypeptidase-like regulatory domain-containing protein [Flavobacterium gawalongense]TRX05025.1 carboxypeptidase-like regulatory domain-containing protein [Flavobacterium gawalongense]TRX08943.1 carboxypeptidase-like regulatory domain-containing protein [Flavobacterium gawalongense]TRX10070.1 carboxypeptidase-like regulatory domain-containing protein [Flavobacterium gawalongense]
MKKYCLLLISLISITNNAQIKGTVSDEKGNPLPFVTIFQEETYNGTTSNELGKYELNLKKTENQTVIFQYLGFKAQKAAIQTEQFPYSLDVKMVEESYSLNEVVINTKINPAIAIIKNAIASKKENTEKTARFKADFYSRGIFKLKNAPKKIFGQKIGDMDGSLDSTGTGIISLSETFSKITFEKPNNLKEIVTASKVSGRDNDYSYNTARSSFYDFYDNTVDFKVNMISPIANNAFNYYKYKLESTFYDENNQMINKIKVTPKRDSEPVFEGYIYIAEDSWAIYAVHLDIKGYRMKEEFVDVMTLKQNFSYNRNSKIWAKNTQSLEITAGAFGIKFTGKYNYVYSNYEFVNSFAKKTFTNEITNVEINSNKKDSLFWNNNRPIPLTFEESNDYIRKDSIYKVRNSKKYLDSIDAKGNKFKIQKILTGYTYKNSTEKHSFSYEGLLNLGSLSFNTVQGYNFDTGFRYTNWKNQEKGKNTSISTKLNYGFSDDRLRVTGSFIHRFNNQDYGTLYLTGGNTVKQFNAEQPISKAINTISSLAFKNNYMKLYNLEFATIGYSQDIANGVNLNGKIESQQRKPLFNTTDFSYFNKQNLYTSNNPLAPDDFITPVFEKHHLMKINLNAKINFGNKYSSRPDGKFNIRNEIYPTLYLGYEKGFAANEKKYEFDHVNARLNYEAALGNKGNIGLNLKAGKFFNAENISFVDYKHFNGNQTHIGQTERYLNVFNILPYYSNSTNDRYFEAHAEYNDEGYIMNKIPLLNKLKSTLILGAHSLSTPNLKPYTEFTVGLDNLGFGKFKMFRVDYVRSYQNGFQGDGVIFGLKFLNILE